MNLSLDPVYQRVHAAGRLRDETLPTTQEFIRGADGHWCCTNISLFYEYRTGEVRAAVFLLASALSTVSSYKHCCCSLYLLKKTLADKQSRCAKDARCFTGIRPVVFCSLHETPYEANRGWTSTCSVPFETRNGMIDIPHRFRTTATTLGHRLSKHSRCT